jgi:transcriptional regulator with XRE-family HTH domain
MQTNRNDISENIRVTRKAKRLTQAELDTAAGLPTSSISKVESKRRELTATEFVRVSDVLAITLDSLAGREAICVYSEEARLIEALREIPFEDYKRILLQIESSLHFMSKDKELEVQTKLREMVLTLSKLANDDSRPRSRFQEVKRVRK